MWEPSLLTPACVKPISNMQDYSLFLHHRNVKIEKKEKMKAQGGKRIRIVKGVNNKEQVKSILVVRDKRAEQ